MSDILQYGALGLLGLVIVGGFKLASGHLLHVEDKLSNISVSLVELATWVRTHGEETRELRELRESLRRQNDELKKRIKEMG